MRKVELLEHALAEIRKCGYAIREECVGGNGGGSCVFSGKKWFFVDPLLEIHEQLDLACDTLRSEPGLCAADLPVELAAFVFPAGLTLAEDNSQSSRRAA